MITDVPGIRVGHWTDSAARTGCTVVLPPPDHVASGEIRGGAPAERDFALLAPERSVQQVAAVVLSGGSVWGLATVDGALRWCEEQGRGLETPAGRVPVVVGMSIFDLLVAEQGRRPGPDGGYAACEDAAKGDGFETGSVGAGTGATVAGWRGLDQARPGGIGSASARHGDLVVGALAVANAFGEPFDPTAERPSPEPAAAPPLPLGNTTLAVVATNARIDKLGCFLTSQSGHDGMARALEPAHSTLDGDAVVALATQEVDATLETVRTLAARTVESAIRHGAAGG
jgi:L-aminopeptidase/D-esterase-like protein